MNHPKKRIIFFRASVEHAYRCLIPMQNPLLPFFPCTRKMFFRYLKRSLPWPVVRAIRQTIVQSSPNLDKHNAYYLLPIHHPRILYPSPEHRYFDWLPPKEPSALTLSSQMDARYESADSRNFSLLVSLEDRATWWMVTLMDLDFKINPKRWKQLSRRISEQMANECCEM